MQPVGMLSARSAATVGCIALSLGCLRQPPPAAATAPEPSSVSRESLDRPGHEARVPAPPAVSPPVPVKVPSPSKFDAASMVGECSKGLPPATGGYHASTPDIQWRPPEDAARWGPAVNGYTSAVRPDNRMPLTDAAPAFAAYTVQMHDRMHPHFSGYLDSLPERSDTCAWQVLLEIVLDGAGQVVKLGVLDSSGAPEFDSSTLEAVQRGAPYGSAPATIVSADGHVYVHWRFYRMPLFACSSYFALPFLLTGS